MAASGGQYSCLVGLRGGINSRSLRSMVPPPHSWFLVFALCVFLPTMALFIKKSFKYFMYLQIWLPLVPNVLALQMLWVIRSYTLYSSSFPVPHICPSCIPSDHGIVFLMILLIAFHLLIFLEEKQTTRQVDFRQIMGEYRYNLFSKF